MKKLSIGLRWYFLIAFCILGAMEATDLQRGITFSPTEHITNTKLHNLIDETTIATSFFTDKSSAQPVASDVFLFVQPGTPAYRKTTFDTMFLSNTNLIVGQVEQDSPVTNDYLLIFDSSAGALAKTPIAALFTNALIGTLPDYTNVPPGGFSYAYNYQGAGGRIEHSNLFAGFWQWENLSTNVASVNPLTNPPVMSVHANPTNADMMMIWDALNQTQKVTTLVGLITNLPPTSKFTNSDTFRILSTRTNNANQFGTNAVVSKATIADLFTNYFESAVQTGSFDSTSHVASTDTLMLWSTATNASPDATNFPSKVKLSSLFRRFVTNGIPVTSGLAAQGLHGLGGRPQMIRWYLVCTNGAGDLGYGQFDKIPLEATEGSSGGLVAGGGANYSQVFCTLRTATPNVVQKGSTSATAAITAVRWNLMCEAEFWLYY